jgi:VWFA-related protein
LRASEVQVFEDGVPQRIESFELVRREARDPGPPGATSTPEVAAKSTQTFPSSREPSRVLAIVLDRMDTAGRSLAQTALVQFLAGIPRSDLIGLFSIDPSLAVLQPFTDDATSVSRAVDEYMHRGATPYDTGRDADRLRDLQQRIAALGGDAFDLGAIAYAAPAEVAGSAGPTLAGGTRDPAELHRLRLEADILGSFVSMERDQQGLSSVNALLALVNGLRRLPGRKAVLLLSQGLSLPDRAMAGFEAVVAEANRAQVSFNVAETGGLRVQSSLAEARREQAAVMAAKSQQQRDILLKSMERNENMLRLSPESGLGRLADQTGGFLTSDTNDLGAALRRVDEETSSYYLLSYTPTNVSFDGGFRRISVNVKRPHLTVQSRGGYYALREMMPTPVLPYEAHALAALDASPRPAAIAFEAQAFVFPDVGGSRVVVLADVPRAGWSAQTDRKAGVRRQDGVVIALVRDAGRRPVRKLSQRYSLEDPLKNDTAPVAGRVLFYKETVLPPGAYAVEFATEDLSKGTIGTAGSRIRVAAAPDGGLSVGDLIVIRSAERAGDSDAPTSPLRVGGVLVYPALSPRISRAAAGAVGVLATARPAPGTSPEAQVEVLQGGATRLTARLVATRTSTGLVQWSGVLRLGELPPGDYTLRLAASDPSGLVTRQAQLVIEP